MVLLALFEFFNIQNYTVDSGSKWGEIIITAFFSGGVAWFAAYMQNKYVEFNKYNDDYRENLYVKDTLTAESSEISRNLKLFYSQELRSSRKIKYGSVLNTSYNEIVMSSFDLISTFNYKKIKELSDLQVDSSTKNVIKKYYDSIVSFKKDYDKLITLYLTKVDEWNKVAYGNYNDIQYVIVPVQKIIFSQEEESIIRYLSSLNVQELNIYLENNTVQRFKIELRDIFVIYQNDIESGFPYYKSIEKMFKKLLIVVRKYQGIELLNIETVQSISNALAGFESIKVFFEGYRNVKRTHLQLINSYVINVSKFQESNIIIPKKMTFFKFIFS